MCVYIYIYIYILVHDINLLISYHNIVLGTRQVSLPQIRRQRKLPRTSEVCPYIVKDLILRTSEVFCPRGQGNILGSQGG